MTRRRRPSTPTQPEAALVEAAIETITIATRADAPEEFIALTATRRRLVDLIAERARLPSERRLEVEADGVIDAAAQAVHVETPPEVADDHRH